LESTSLNDKNVVVQAWAGPVRPGDTLILGFTGHINMAEAQRVRERFAELLPGVTVVVLDQVTQVVVYRPDEE
jgi:hypothetical protein